MSTDVAREGDALCFRGPLERTAVASVWPRAVAMLEGAASLDLRHVERIDSAGLALLAELSARAGRRLVLLGRPAGLDDLRAAYRLDEALGGAG